MRTDEEFLSRLHRIVLIPFIADACRLIYMSLRNPEQVGKHAGYITALSQPICNLPSLLRDPNTGTIEQPAKKDRRGPESRQRSTSASHRDAQLRT
eukprot:scaffold67446_cov19-Tisochrysis_lutea.AAC.1